MKYSREILIKSIESGKMLDFVFFWKQTAAPGEITNACFCQWYPCTFTIEDVSYCCTEQYMMAQKALLFGDREIYERIMLEQKPHEIKALGRLVQHFDAAAWDAAKYDIVLQGNLAKFSQNKALSDLLLATKDAVLAEASPFDKIWGIRLSEDNPKVRDPHCWRGENLLGFVLMEVRDHLQAAAYCP